MINRHPHHHLHHLHHCLQVDGTPFTKDANIPDINTTIKPDSINNTNGNTKLFSKQYKENIIKSINHCNNKCINVQCQITYPNAINMLLLDPKHQSFVFILIKDEQGLNNASNQQIVERSFQVGYDIIFILYSYVGAKENPIDPNTGLLAAVKPGNVLVSTGKIIKDKNGDEIEEKIGLIDLMLSKGANNYDDAVITAAYFNNIYSMKRMFEVGSTNYGGALTGAVRGGHINIIDALLNLNIDPQNPVINYDYDSAMIDAVRYGQIDSVKRMLNPYKEFPNIGATNYIDGIISATEHGHTDIVKLMFHPDPNDSAKDMDPHYFESKFKQALLLAAKGGYIDIVKYMLNNSVPLSEDALEAAAQNGHLDIAIFLIESKKLDYYNNVMRTAASTGYIDVVKSMIEIGADDYDNTMISATVGGHIDIVRLMLEKGATDYNGAMIAAGQSGHNNITALIKQWKNTHA